MRVAVDAHAIGQRLTGNEVYVRALIGRFPRLDSETEFITYIASPEAVSWLPASVTKRWVSKNPFVRLGGELSAKLRADRPDLVHVQYTAPLFCPVPVVVTIHDVSYMEHPEFLPRPRAIQLQLSTRHTLKRAAKVITISEFSRQHIARVFGVDPEAIAVTPLASQESFRVMYRDRQTRPGCGCRMTSPQSVPLNHRPYQKTRRRYQPSRRMARRYSRPSPGPAAYCWSMRAIRHADN
jgi:hypothetical protein